MRYAAICTLALTAALGGGPAAAEVPAGQTAPERVAAALTVATATVTAVDKAAREVTLSDADGNSFTLPVGPEVRNFDQVEVGDKLKIQYFERLALSLSPGAGGATARIEKTEVSRADPGQKPHGTITRQVDVIAEVVALDAAARTVTLRGQKGTITLQVADDVDLSKVAVGDSVKARYAETLAISVEGKP